VTTTFGGTKTTPLTAVLLDNLTVAQLVKKFLAFNVSRRSISAFVRSSQLDSIISQINPVHALTISFRFISISSIYY
jgi:hypothetical protein